jgi:hypothetical protein
MVNLIEDNKELNYKVYNSEFIASRLVPIRLEGKFHHASYRQHFPNSTTGSTWDYDKYNIFALAGPSMLFYQIYKELSFVIKEHLADQGDLPDAVWFQSWLNYHKQDEVLDWHNHRFPYHGYISIDPKDTTTEFEGFSIKNKPGNIYIGEGHKQHRVVVNTPYTDTRITLGFDIVARPQLTHNLSFIPIIL